MKLIFILCAIILVFIIICIVNIKLVIKYKNKSKYYLDCYTRVLQYKEKLQNEITNLHNGDTVNNALDKLSEH